ncbi:hypothetical protein L9F63_023114, partial [Diploptera punctata]
VKFRHKMYFPKMQFADYLLVHLIHYMILEYTRFCIFSSLRCPYMFHLFYCHLFPSVEDEVFHAGSVLKSPAMFITASVGVEGLMYIPITRCAHPSTISQSVSLSMPFSFIWRAFLRLRLTTSIHVVNSSIMSSTFRDILFIILSSNSLSENDLCISLMDVLSFRLSALYLSLSYLKFIRLTYFTEGFAPLAYSLSFNGVQLLLLCFKISSCSKTHIRELLSNMHNI